MKHPQLCQDTRHFFCLRVLVAAFGAAGASGLGQNQNRSSTPVGTDCAFTFNSWGHWLDVTDVSREGSAYVSGVAADGVTQLRMHYYYDPAAPNRHLPPGQHTATFRLADEFGSSDPASVGVLCDDAGDDCGVILPNLPHNENTLEWDVRYRPPIDFVRPGNAEDTITHQPRRIRISVTLDSGASQVTVCADFPLYRPPVLLLHGLHDDGSSWQWDLLGDERFFAYAPSYPNNLPFKDNMGAMRYLVQIGLDHYRSLGIAATQVDVFGHSMGGLLARRYAQNFAGNYLREDNYFKGDYHKLILVNSPQLGSPIAPLLVRKSGALTCAGKVGFFGSERVRTDKGAIRDHRPDSDEINLINSSPLPVAIPVHGMINDGGSTCPWSEYSQEKVWQLRGCYLLPSASENVLYDRVMRGHLHDCVVPIRSQTVGDDPHNADWITWNEGCDGQHYPVINPDELTDANEDAVRTLNASVEDKDVFRDGFPIPGELLQLPQPCVVKIRGDPTCFLDFARASASGSIDILTPLEGTEIYSGHSVEVAVSVTHPAAAYVLLSASTGGTRVLTSSPFVATFQIPIAFLGTATFEAWAADWDGNVVPSTPVHVNVVPKATLMQIESDYTRILLYSWHHTLRLQTWGVYDDGLRRDLTGTSGISYVSTAPSIVSMESDGVLSACGIGSGTIRISHGGIDLDVPVDVVSIPADKDRNGDVDSDDIRWLVPSDASPGMGGPTRRIDSYDEYRELLDIFDFDTDGDLDLHDWTSAQNRFTGNRCTGVSCDDGNQCIRDYCMAGTCFHEQVPFLTVCDDGDACTVGDVCEGAICTGSVLSCFDGNPCTDDSCMAGVCYYDHNLAECDDHDACTIDDHCSLGQCIGSSMSCDDGNSVTCDYCVGGMCSSVPILTECSSAVGDCFAPSAGQIGCESECCCSSVCSVDEFCCFIAWDTGCAFVAMQICDP